MKGAGGQLHDRIETREMIWKFNPDFLDIIKALNAAAGSASVSREALELAARRLYEGRQAETGGPEVRAGSPGSGGSGFFSIDYAAYRLNKAGLESEVAQAGAWLESARGGGQRLEIEGAYSAAFSFYRELIVAASALKGRETVTGGESRRLEELRLKLRSALAALAPWSRPPFYRKRKPSEKLGASRAPQSCSVGVAPKGGTGGLGARIAAGGAARPGAGGERRGSISPALPQVLSLRRAA